jgi:FKBP-type peptidyl-prolyl cis-trans isomerase
MRAALSLAALIALALPAPAPAQGAKKADPTALRAVGLSVAKQLEVFAFSAPELDQVLKGIREGATGKATFDPATMQPQIQALVQERIARASDREKQKGQSALDQAVKQKGSERTASGLVFLPLREGTGPSPAATDKVRVHYRGTFVDGKEFDSSYSRGEPAEFPLNGVIPCWTEGLQKMKVGGKARLVCPAAIAYGERGRPPAIPGNAVLTFEVELLEIVK